MTFVSKTKTAYLSAKKPRSALLSLLLVILLAFPSSLPLAAVAAGPPTIISYQGRLANSSGDLLGGSGAVYYFKFSIWDNATVGSGTRLWPSSVPSSVSLTVRQGVFTANIGDTAAGFPHALDYDFSTASDIYLQVEASSDDATFQTLSPRQRIGASAFARLSNAVSGTTTPSSFGTTTPIPNAVVTIEATSTSAIPLFIRGIASQIADLFRIQNSAGTHLVSVSASGGLFASSTFQVTGATQLYSTLNVSGLTTLGQASSTRLSVFDTAYFGGTATTTIGSDGIINVVNGASVTTDMFGHLGADNNTWAASRGALQFYDGTASTYLVGTLSSDAPLNNQVPKWNTGGTITWEDDISSAGAGVSTIQEQDATVEAAATTIDFLGADFDITSSPAGEANVVIDYAGSGITRVGQNEIITGNWRFNQASTTLLSNTNTAYFGGTATSTFNSAGVLTLATDLAVSEGGTGRSSWTQYLIPYADTTTSFSQIAIGTSGQVLTSNGAGSAATFQDAASSGANSKWATSTSPLALHPNAPTARVSVGTTTASSLASLTVSATSTDTTTLLSLLNDTSASVFSVTDEGLLTVGDDLTVSGGDITLATSLIFSGGDTTSLNLIDAVDATTETTIEASIDTLANLTAASALATVGTITTGVWNGTTIAVANGGTGITSFGAGAATSLDTGEGANELFDMDQNVLTTSNVRFLQASTTLLSNVGTAYFGGTATSTFNSAGVLTLASDLAVSEGGTGRSSWTQYLIPYADTTTSFSQIAIGTSGQVLTSNGAGSAATFQDAASSG